METIKNYLESMFRGLPLTDKVVRAKSELLQMMEDKYTELIRNGKTENEAVGEVIQNFGNLEEIADDLGIKEILSQTKFTDSNRRKLSFDEITECLATEKKSVIYRATAIFMFIICVSFPILASALHLENFIGAILMFLSIGAGVVFFSLSRAIMEQWHFIRTEPCSIDSVSADYLKNKNREFTSTYSVLSSVGILLCILCFIPQLFFESFGGRFMEKMGGVMFFVFIGLGVALMIYAKSIKRSYQKLLNLNDKIDFEEKPEENLIQNKTIRIILSVYWSLVTCIYLCVSFLTFKWGITWLIFPIAVVVRTILKGIYETEPETSEKSE